MPRPTPPGSIHSWWSDSNPPGPTISMHAVSKPIMWSMYHLQVLAFIRRNSETPLSRRTLEIYSSYIEFKYLSSWTKTAILSDLEKKALMAENAEAVAASPILIQLPKLLESSHQDVRRRTCWLVGRLAFHESTEAAVSGAIFCPLLLALLWDKDTDVLIGATYALSQISRWPNGAHSIINGDALGQIARLLESPNAEVRRWTCWIVARIAAHEPNVVTILRAIPCQRLVSLLENDNIEVVVGAIYAISQITAWPEGAQAAVNARVLTHVIDLLASAHYQVRRSTCWMLGRLALHERTAILALRQLYCEKLVALLQDSDMDVRIGATYALAKITRWPDGVAAALAANAQQHVAELLASPNAHMQGMNRGGLDDRQKAHQGMKRETHLSKSSRPSNYFDRVFTGCHASLQVFTG
ncbi:armadillo-type protein [Mycena crocata]|nr:armadillo-type protein [Mycena crocata]